jgi:hypothetical protein
MSNTVVRKKHIALKIFAILMAVILILVIAVVVFLKMTFLKSFPELNGEPEVGVWYRITPENAKSSDGSEWHGIFRKGSENKVVVYFFGGGVSITGETSEGGTDFFATTMAAQDFVAQGGIGSMADENPFRDWTFIVIPYASGDFHTGTGEYHYTQNGKEKVVYHNGYNNYSAFIEEIKEYVGEPDTLLVTGFSAGGFATSLLADDVIDRFPTAQNITVCVDSSLLLYDGWHDTAVNLWQSPKEISDRLTTNNIVLDSLTALYEKRGDSVKILFDCSYRDDTLQQYQAYINNGKMDKTKELGDQFQQNLKDMVEGLQENIPGVGICIWNFNEDEETHNTQHTIISGNVFDKLGNERSVCEWIYDAVMGDVQTIGLKLLD